MIRTFIALDLPQAVQTGLEALSKEFRRTGAAVSWSRIESIHLTLKFLGNIPEEQVPRIGEALERIAGDTAPFRLEPCGCGAFPTIQRMRVVWVGVGGEREPLRSLAGRVEAAMAELGHKPEDRPFQAHLTVGRVKGRERLKPLQDLLVARSAFRAEAFDVTELVLYKSDLRPEGALYTPLIRAKFGAKA